MTYTEEIREDAQGDARDKVNDAFSKAFNFERRGTRVIVTGVNLQRITEVAPEVATVITALFTQKYAEFSTENETTYVPDYSLSTVLGRRARRRTHPLQGAFSNARRRTEMLGEEL